MIRFSSVQKKFGKRLALESVSFDANSSKVTAVVGPNGSGKSTLFRILLGLATSDSGGATIEGLNYRDLGFPLKKIGAHLDVNFGSKSRTAVQFLRIQALSQSINRNRIAVVLEQVGLADVSNNRIATFSLGMKQRLGIAHSLLGDPDYLVFDEPLNGLDHEGMLWFRRLIRELADQGKTILLSSHILSEVEELADEVIFLGRGRTLGSVRPSELGQYAFQLVGYASTEDSLVEELKLDRLLRFGKLALVSAEDRNYWIDYLANHQDLALKLIPVKSALTSIYEEVSQGESEFVGIYETA